MAKWQKCLFQQARTHTYAAPYISGVVCPLFVIFSWMYIDSSSFCCSCSHSNWLKCYHRIRCLALSMDRFPSMRFTYFGLLPTYWEDARFPCHSHFHCAVSEFIRNLLEALRIASYQVPRKIISRVVQWSMQFSSQLLNCLLHLWLLRWEFSRA